MIYKLTDQVWWGDRHAISEAPTQIHSVLNVSHNQRGSYFNSMKQLPQEVPYFRLGRKDRYEMDVEYLRALNGVADIIIANKWYPCLVHCLVGGHRSPGAAVFLGWRIANRSLEALGKLRAEMLRLRSDVAINQPYHRSLYEYCLANSV
jgi:hypothetical protein